MASLPGATPLPAVTVDGTRVIPTSAASPSATRALPRMANRPARRDPRDSRGPRDRRVRGRRLGWLAVPAVALVALVAWGAVALAGAMQAPVAGPAARPRVRPRGDRHAEQHAQLVTEPGHERRRPLGDAEPDVEHDPEQHVEQGRPRVHDLQAAARPPRQGQGEGQGQVDDRPPRPARPARCRRPTSGPG